ncbi:MAG: hypothetical protein ACKO96_18930 [Flammeovirgaceae bacterium]
MPKSTKSFTLTGLKDFKLNTHFENDCSKLNDPTPKFALGKKPKQATDLLMSLNFISAEDEQTTAGLVQVLERRIKETEKTA